MNCIVIEDEQHAAEHLISQLELTGYEITVQARLNSIKKAVSWLGENKTDLIFLDIELSDGLSFEIFEQVKVNTPVIFTTSYDQYSIKAFELNSLSYLLKPVDVEDLVPVLDKYKTLYPSSVDIGEKIASLNPNYRKRFLVQSGNVLRSIAVEDIIYIQVQKKYVVLVSSGGMQYFFESTLDSLEQRLDPEKFFRINKQFIIQINAIENMYPHTRGRLRIETTSKSKEEMVVGVEKSAAFRDWLNK